MELNCPPLKTAAMAFSSSEFRRDLKTYPEAPKPKPARTKSMSSWSDKKMILAGQPAFFSRLATSKPLISPKRDVQDDQVGVESSGMLDDRSSIRQRPCNLVGAAATFATRSSNRS